NEKPVAETAAPAWLHTHAQTALLGGDAFLLHEALDFNCRSRREGDRGGGLLSCAHAKPLRCEQGTSPDWFILYKVTRESGMGKSPPHATPPPPPPPPPRGWAKRKREKGR